MEEEHKGEKVVGRVGPSISTTALLVLFAIIATSGLFIFFTSPNFAPRSASDWREEILALRRTEPYTEQEKEEINESLRAQIIVNQDIDFEEVENSLRESPQRTFTSKEREEIEDKLRSR